MSSPRGVIAAGSYRLVAGGLKVDRGTPSEARHGLLAERS